MDRAGAIDVDPAPAHERVALPEYGGTDEAARRSRDVPVRETFQHVSISFATGRSWIVFSTGLTGSPKTVLDFGGGKLTVAINENPRTVSDPGASRLVGFFGQDPEETVSVPSGTRGVFPGAVSSLILGNVRELRG